MVITMVKKVGAVEARTKLGELLARAQYAGERFIITKDGKDAAALLSVAELQRLERLEDLLDMLVVKLLKARQSEPLPVEALLEQYERLFGKKAHPTVSK